MTTATLFVAATTAWSTGCAAPPSALQQQRDVQALSRLAPPRESRLAPGDSTNSVVATVGGEPVTLQALLPLLYEAAGAEALEEYALDRALTRELDREGLRIDQEAVQQERRLLLEQLGNAVEAPADSAQAAEALAQLRAQRGLGPSRFAALLWRTAALRALVQLRDPVTISESAIEQAYDMAYGERRVARVITLPTLTEAQQALEALQQGADFASLAATRSTDASAERGGLLEPLSRRDPAYPPAIRQALFALSPGRWSNPIAVEQGFAILKLERVIPAQNRPLEQVREQLVRDLTVRQERLRMDELARSLLQRVAPVALEDHLRWSWTATRGSP